MSPLMSTRLTIAAALVLATPAFAGPLEDTLAAAYESNPRLAAGRAALRAVDEELPKALGSRRPRLNASSSAGVSQITGGGDSEVVSTLRQSLAVRQAIHTGGEGKAADARAEDLVRLERARLGALEQAVLLEAVAAFTAVARDQRRLRLAQTNETRLASQLRATQDRRRFGDATDTDVNLARTRAARATANRIAAEGRLEGSAAEFERVVGRAPGTVDLPTPAAELPATLAAALESADDTFGYLAARHELAVSRDEVDLASAAMRPRLDLEAGVSLLQATSSSLDSRTDASLGTTLTMPLYQGGADRAQVRQSKESWRRRQHALDDALRTAAAEIAAAFAANASATGQIGSLQVQAEAAAFALDGVRQEVLVGTRGVIEVLDAEEDLFDAELALAEAERERVLAGWRLRAATGTLTAASLNLPVQLDDPNRHYEAVRRQWFGVGEKLPRG